VFVSQRDSARALFSNSGPPASLSSASPWSATNPATLPWGGGGGVDLDLFPFGASYSPPVTVPSRTYSIIGGDLNAASAGTASAQAGGLLAFVLISAATRFRGQTSESLSPTNGHARPPRDVARRHCHRHHLHKPPIPSFRLAGRDRLSRSIAQASAFWVPRHARRCSKAVTALSSFPRAGAAAPSLPSSLAAGFWPSPLRGFFFLLTHFVHANSRMSRPILFLGPSSASVLLFTAASRE